MNVTQELVTDLRSTGFDVVVQDSERSDILADLVINGHEASPISVPSSFQELCDESSDPHSFMYPQIFESVKDLATAIDLYHSDSSSSLDHQNSQIIQDITV